MDQNRYEEVPQKENKFLKGLKGLGRYFKFVFVDFFNSFKYNNMKLAAILFALPGLLLGFFMFAHVPTIRNVSVSYVRSIEGTDTTFAPTLGADGTYTYTLDKYLFDGTEYQNVALKLTAVDTTASSYNEDFQPVDGTAKGSKTTQLPTPVATLEGDGDSYTLTVTGMDEVATQVESYSVFLYRQVGQNYYHITYTDVNGVSLVNGEAKLTFNALSASSDYVYKVRVKAIPKASNQYYASKLSEINDASGYVTVSANGSNYSEADYNSTSIKFVQYAGTYEVANPADDNISKLRVKINDNGTVEYTGGNKAVEARLQLAGSNLRSSAQETVYIIPFDFSGMAIFFLTLLGFLNVFISLELSKKKNLGSVIKAALLTAAIVIIGGLYIYAIVATDNALKSGELKLSTATTMFDTNCIISISVVIAAAVFSLAGLVLAFINYDRTYEKVDR